MLLKRKHSAQRNVLGGGNKDVEYMAPALKNVLTLQDHYSLNVSYIHFLKDTVVLFTLIQSLVLSLSSSNSSSLKVCSVPFTSCPSFESWLKSHILYKALPDICETQSLF